MTLTRIKAGMVGDGWLRPEQFGPIGVSAAKDTAAWKKLVAAANAQGGAVKIDLGGDTYLINGTGTAVDDQTFTNFTSIWIRGKEGTVVRQKQSLAKTFKFVRSDTTGKVKISGIKFVGYAQDQIDASLPLVEGTFAFWNGSSGNAVAAIYAERIEEMRVERVETQAHCGRDIFCYGVLNLIGRDLTLVGVGPAYNRPLIDGHQGNGEDAAIYHIPHKSGLSYYNPATTTAWRQSLNVCNSSIKWHSFGIRTILNNVLRLHGNTFGETPGQHHVYDSDSDGHSIIGNSFEDCRQFGYKMQFENLAGFDYGPLYDANKPAYSIGDVVRAVSVLWVCKTAYSPGGAGFSSTNWSQHPRFIRRGGVWQGNRFRRCGEGGIALLASSNVYGRNIWSEGYVIAGNDIESGNVGLRLDRCWKAKIQGNNIRNAINNGIFGTDFNGTIDANEIWTAGKQGILLSISHNSKFERNAHWNCGRSGADDSERAAVVLYAPDANSPPDNAANPRIFSEGDSFFYFPIAEISSGSDAPGSYLLWGTDTRLNWEIVGTKGTPTTKKFRIDGSVVHQFRNHFAANGFANTAQNEPDFTLTGNTPDFALNPTTDTTTGVGNVLATLIDALTARRLII